MFGVVTGKKGGFGTLGSSECSVPELEGGKGLPLFLVAVRFVAKLASPVPLLLDSGFPWLGRPSRQHPVLV